MIIASRILGLRDGTRISVDVFTPAKDDKGGWRCRYDIDWPSGKRSFYGSGIDSVQALLIACGMIGTELYSSEYHKRGDLIWNEPRTGYGFPVPPNLRDMLVGDDAKYL